MKHIFTRSRVLLFLALLLLVVVVLLAVVVVLKDEMNSIYQRVTNRMKCVCVSYLQLSLTQFDSTRRQ